MAQARSGPPPIPPRVDLGENEEISTIRHDDAATDGSINSTGSAPGIPLTDTVTKHEHVAASKPLPNPVPKPSVTTKPELHHAAKATKPSKKKEIKGRPEISIVSARPMDQSNFVLATNSKIENGTPISQDNNNSSNKPIVTPMESVKSTVENKKPSKPALSPPKKPPPYNSNAEGSSTTSSAPSKVVPASGRAIRTKDKKKEPSSSIFYLDNTDVNLMQSKEDKAMSSKTKNRNLSSEVNAKSVDKLSLPAPRKTKRKEEQIKRPVETESTAVRKQPEIAASKPKFRPTIIISKKPKNADVIGSDKVKKKALSNTAAQVANNSGSNSVEAPAEDDPPGRPNCTPSTVVEELNKGMPQPQRPKAPPNTIPEAQKHPSKENKDEGQKDSKNKDSIQKRPKVRPARPPMAKESARIKPTRPAPALSDVARKTPSVKAEELSVSEKKSDTAPVVRSPDKDGSPRAIAKFDYTGETTDDLSFKAGDTILLTSKVGNDWLVGYLEGNVVLQGLFPVRFVDIIVNVKDENPKEKVQEPVSSDSLAVAVHDFKGQTDGELSFSSGETITLIERIDNDWLKGKINNTVGIFPLNFVRIERDFLESAVNNKTVVLQGDYNNATVEKPDSEWCRANHDFQGEREDDLSFVVGNEIRITERLDLDWLKGEFSGKSGIFPASFVEMIYSEADKTSKDVTDTVVTVLHDYAGETPEDLSFCVGDKIKVVERINKDWLMGEFNGKAGLFPSSFVDCAPELLPEPSSNKELQQPKDTRIAKAVHDFNGEHPGELNFKIGEKIQVVREIDNDWCEGMIDNRSGIFPISFVEMEHLQVKEISCAKALYDFDGGSEHDLSFKVGDVIQLLQHVNEDWWTGSFGGKTGHFPATFVAIVANPS